MSHSESKPLMGGGLMFLDCPAYLDRDGAERCGLPAEVKCRFVMESTDGPLDSAIIRCPAGHWFTGALESLTLTTGPGPPALPGRHDSRALADGMVAVLILGELLCGAGLAARGVADRRRLAAWDAAWRAIGPQWGGHP